VSIWQREATKEYHPRPTRTKVIDEIGHGQQIESCQQVAAVSGRIIVISVNGKEGQIDGVMRVLVIEVRGGKIGLGGVAQTLQADGIGTQTIASQDLHGLVQRASAGAVFVKEVARQEDHVGLVAFGQVEDFFKGRKGVHACVRVWCVCVCVCVCVIK
jgi:hypothetical protein